jgi:hypothetical protein
MTRAANNVAAKQTIAGVIIWLVEEFKRPLTEREIDVELNKSPREIDYDDLLSRDGSSNRGRVLAVAEYELRRMPGGRENGRAVEKEHYETRGYDRDYVDQSRIVRKVNEVMGSPLKLESLPGWAKPRRFE